MHEKDQLIEKLRSVYIVEKDRHQVLNHTFEGNFESRSKFTLEMLGGGLKRGHNSAEFIFVLGIALTHSLHESLNNPSDDFELLVFRYLFTDWKEAKWVVEIIYVFEGQSLLTDLARLTRLDNLNRFLYDEAGQVK